MTTIRTIIVYDKEGTIISCFNADSVEPPVGVPYIITEIPAGATVVKVDIKTMQPIYQMNDEAISELDKMNAKMDYIAMMTDIDVSLVLDPLQTEQHIPQVMDLQEDHNKNYIKVYNYYLGGLWSLSAVRNAIGKWINQTEYTEIVLAKDQQDIIDDSIDSENEIPVVNVKE